MEIRYQNNMFCDAIKEIAKLIKGTKWENNCFLVGGAVRDLLLGKEIKDIDLCISLPNGGIDFANWICKETDCYKINSNPVIFQTYGTAKFNIRSINKISNVNIECVQTRKEQYKDKNSRNPETEYGTITEDSLRRDLTINALYINISNNQVLDPTGMGLSDLKNCILRTPSDPDITFTDDALRQLRVIRFSSKLGWGIEKTTWFGIVKNAYRINTISKERISEEISKILESNRPSYGLRKLYNSGLLKLILPEVYELVGCKQGEQHFGDVFEHTMAVVEKTKPIATYRMAALLHDIAKPKCKIEMLDKIHFYKHENESAIMSINILKRLKYSNSDIKLIVKAVRNHMRFKQNKDSCPSTKAIRKLISEYNDSEVDIILDIIDADNKSHSEKYNAPNQVNLIFDKILKIKEEEKINNKLELPINGKDIMDKFKLKTSPKIGEMLNFIKNKFLENPKLTKEECFSLIESNFK